MAMTCPACGGEISSEDVNVAKDVAFCRACGKANALSEIVSGTVVRDTDLSAPPKGAWYRDDGMEVVVGASWRSVSTGLFFILFAAFWNAVSWGLIIAMATGASNVNGPGISSVNGKTVVAPVAYLFMTPFVLVGAGMALAAVVVFFGRAEVTIRGTEAELFRGVGMAGLRKRFSAGDVTAVSVKPASFTRNKQTVYCIVIEGPAVKFGSGFSDERRQFVAAALRKSLCG